MAKMYIQSQVIKYKHMQDKTYFLIVCFLVTYSEIMRLRTILGISVVTLQCNVANLAFTLHYKIWYHLTKAHFKFKVHSFVTHTSIMLWFSTWEFFILSIRMSFYKGPFESKVKRHIKNVNWPFSSVLWWTNLCDFSVSQRQRKQGFLKFGLWTFRGLTLSSCS